MIQIIGCFLIVLLTHIIGQAEEYTPVQAAIHLDSQVSDDDGFPIPKLVEVVRSQGIKVAMITDHDNMAVEYGVWPLEGIFKYRVNLHSIQKFGAKRYLEEFKKASQAHPDIVILHGAEAIPAYFWDTNGKNVWQLIWQAVSGDEPWANNIKENLILRDFHKHLLVIGMEKAEDYERLPSVGAGFPRVYSWKFVVRLWPAIILVIGIAFFKKKRKYRVRVGEVSYKKVKYPYRYWGGVLIVLGILFLYNNFPFSPRQYDQYHGDPGIGPYQAMIDYANKRGGMVFWAHPEADSAKGSMGMAFRTGSYEQDLLRTQDYTGFAIFWEGISRTGSVGGIWDQVLDQYCQGTRHKPAWTLGELDYTGEEPRLLHETATILWVKTLTRDGVLDALRNGRMYATRDFAAGYLTLDEFAVSDPVTGKQAISGGRLECSGIPKVRVKITVNDGKRRPLDVIVIRDGKTVFTYPSNGSSAFEFEDKGIGGKGMTYYRIMVRPDFPILASNPIFVKFK